MQINPNECEAQRALRQWVQAACGGNVARAARQLDISWMFLSRLMDGTSRPSVDFVFRAHEVAGIPIQTWRIARRPLKQAVNA